jgi:hypothetical protein
MSVAHFDRRSNRVYVVGTQIHHGAVGVSLVLMGLLGRVVHPPVTRLLLVSTGVMLMIDDWHDFPWTGNSP